MRRIRLRGAGGTAALFVMAWLGIAVAGTQAQGETAETTSAADSNESGLLHLLTSKLTDHEGDDEEWSFEALTSELPWGGEDSGHSRSSQSPLTTAITGQS
jgi:hypothetical protein